MNPRMFSPVFLRSFIVQLAFRNSVLGYWLINRGTPAEEFRPFDVPPVKMTYAPNAFLEIMRIREEKQVLERRERAAFLAAALRKLDSL